MSQRVINYKKLNIAVGTFIIIYFVVNRFQISKMRNIIHSIDPKAFVTINEVADVFKSND